MTSELSGGSLELLEIPIFPLPNVVFFPKTLLPLHIFEPRYRQMVEDCMKGDRRIGMVLQKPEWGELRSGTHPVGGMGEITECERLDDGRFNILLNGHVRFRIVEWLKTVPYRRARIQLAPEKTPDSRATERLSLKLRSAFRELTRHRLKAFDPSLLDRLDFPTLLNSICSTLQIDDLAKQKLLEMDQLESRAESILLIIERLRGQQQFVAKFQHIRPEDPRVN